tara:strand:- start:358 stop:909 length:552 start_codon:yes stop_codon:yes gene_type:complete
MEKKGLLRKKFYLRRKKKYFSINNNFFNPLKNLMKKISKNRGKNISLYYPNSYEVDVFKILENNYFKNFQLLLPSIEEGNSMHFHKWREISTLKVNKYGIPEPINSKKILPAIILVPLLAFDKYKNRLGYGKGYYDKYLFKFKKINKKIISVGIAFSFQKYHKLPNNSRDFKLDYVLTEKGLI